MSAPLPPASPSRVTPADTVQAGNYRLKDWYLLVPFALIGFAFGVWGFLSCDADAACHSPSLADAAFRTLLLCFRIGANYTSHGPTRAPVPLLIGQTMLPLLLVLGTAAAGVRLVLLNLRHDVQLALVRAMRDHVIVCGLGRTGTEAARALLGKRGKVVALDIDALCEGAATVSGLGVPVIIGDATLGRTLARAGVARARAVIMSTGSDARNMEICLDIQASPHAASPALLLFPEVRSHWLQQTLTSQRMPVLSANLSLHPFRANAVLARALLQAAPFRIPGVCPTLLFVGFGDLAETILRTATLSVFAVPGFRVRVICDDLVAAERSRAVCAAPWADFADMTFVARPIAASDGARRDAIRRQLTDHEPDIVIVTLPEDDLSLQMAVDLRNELDRLLRFDVPVFFRAREQVRLSGLLETVNGLPFCAYRLASFGDLAGVVSPDALFDEQFDIMARALQDTYLSHAEGDLPSQRPWSRLPERYRRSSRAAADYIPVNLALAGYGAAKDGGPSAELDQAAVLTMAQAEHHRWVLDMTAEGWVFGERHSDLMRQHPLLVAWDAMPQPFRDANLARARSLPAVLSAAGLRLRHMSFLRLDPTVEAEWACAEAGAGDPDRAVLIRRSPGLRAEALEDLRDRYPQVARSVIGWTGASDGGPIARVPPSLHPSAGC